MLRLCSLGKGGRIVFVKLLALILFVSAALPAVDWTTQNPILTSFEVRNDVGRTVIEVRVTFRGDGGETFVRDYQESGDSALARLQRRIYEDRATLQAAESLTDGMEIPPVAPTPLDEAIADFQLNIRKLQALNTLVTLQGLADNAQIGTSGVTVSQARTALRAAVVADITSQPALHLALENFPQ